MVKDGTLGGKGWMEIVPRSRAVGAAHPTPTRGRSGTRGGQQRGEGKGERRVWRRGPETAEGP